MPNITQTTKTPSSSNVAVFFIPPLIIVIIALIIYIASSDSTPNKIPSTNNQQQPISGSLTAPSKPKDVSTIRRLAENNLSFSIGPQDAKVTVVEFLDFQCPFCQQMANTVDDLTREYEGKSVKFIFRHYPLATIHPHALITAQGAECAREQKAFMPMHDFLYKNQSSINTQTPYTAARQLNLDIQKFSTCMANDRTKVLITKDVTDAIDLNIEGTPTYFINGQKLAGVIEKEVFKTIIDTELKK